MIPTWPLYLIDFVFIVFVCPSVIGITVHKMPDKPVWKIVAVMLLVLLPLAAVTVMIKLLILHCMTG